jgi:tetratricopeptide (TPR) repeat protein
MLLDRGFLVREGAVYRPSETIEKLDVPETLHALVAARLDALHADERRLVQDASVLGKSFSPDALAELLPFDTRQLEELLAALVRKEVLGFQSDPRSPERGQYAFLQDLLRKVAYDTLARRDRKARHLAAADALVARSGGDGEIPEVLASHYVAAYECAPDDPDAGAVRRKAGNALVLAAERAAALAAPGEGQRHFEQAATLADDTSERATLLERAGRLALNANATDQARRLLAQAITLHGEAGDARRAARASAALADVDFAEDRLDDSATRLEGAIEMLDESEPTRELAAALAQLGRAYALRGDIARAADTLERALRMAEVLADEPAFIDALISRSVVLTRQSRMREARILLEAAVAAARDAELPGTWWRAANNLGVVHEDGDRPLEGLELAREMLAQARKRGDRHAEAFAVVGQLSALVAVGRWSEALSILAGAEPLVGSSGILRAQLVDVVPVYCEQGRLEDAEALLAGMADVSATDSAEVKASLETAEAAVRRARGDHAGALEVARRAIARSSELGITNRLVKESFVHAAEASLRLDDLEQTRSLLAVVEHLPPGELTPYLEAHAARFGAHIAARVGDDAEASRRFQAAARAFRASGFAFWHAATLVEHAEWLAATRRPAEAAELAEQARDFLTEVGARPWLDRIDALTGETAARA